MQAGFWVWEDATKLALTVMSHFELYFELVSQIEYFPMQWGTLQGRL